MLVPLAARRADGRGGDEALGEPLFASAPLRCMTTRSTSDDEGVAVLAVLDGLVLANRPKQPGGGTGTGGGGGGAGCRRRTGVVCHQELRDDMRWQYFVLFDDVAADIQSATVGEEDLEATGTYGEGYNSPPDWLH